MIKLTGIADEAGASLDVQIKAHKELGWDSIESRIVEFDGVKGNLPFPVSVHDEENTREELRLRHRYLDLRRERMQRNLRIRAAVNSAVRGCFSKMFTMSSPLKFPFSPRKSFSPPSCSCARRPTSWRRPPSS